jgi:hypothetical protein
MLEESVLILSFGFPMEGPKNRIKLFFEGHRIQISQNNSVSYIQIGLHTNFFFENDTYDC